MATTNDVTMTIRTNGEVKKTAAELFNDLGLDMSTAINMFLRECIRRDGIPFEVSRKEIPNRKTRQAIKNAVNNKNMVGPFKTVEEAPKHLVKETQDAIAEKEALIERLKQQLTII